jgi:hypothetical protein
MSHHPANLNMKVVIGPSRWRSLFLTLAGLAFVGAGIFILLMPPRPGESRSLLVGWSCILFFGACALVGLWQLFDSRPRIILDDDGIFDRMLGSGKIPWGRIQGAYIQSIHGTEFICLELLDADRHLQNLSAAKRALADLNRQLGFTPISLNLAGTNANAAELLEIILKAARLHNRQPPSESVFD